ncbi:MAG: AAA family ATPase [Nannocystaceae bacterium]
MLSRLRVQNFRCLRDVTVDFEPLTVLIGKNDSGKTSILDAIRVLGDTMSRPIPEVFSGVNHPEVLSWRRESKPVSWEITTDRDQHRFLYHLQLDRSLSIKERRSLEVDLSVEDVSAPEKYRRYWSSLAYGLSPELWEIDEDEPADEFYHEKDREELDRSVHELLNLPRYRLDPDALRRPSAPRPDTLLDASGRSLPSLLDGLFSGADASIRTSLEQSLHAAIPTLRGLSLLSFDDSTKTIEYVLAGSGKRPITIPCENASDGALLVTAYLALAYSDAPGTLLIEEPENGLHPSLLRLVFETLHKISTGEYGLGPRQVIIATQSPLLLNYATKEEVRIVRRDLETGTHVSRLADVPDIDRLLKGFSVGELWYHLGEDALVEGETAK